MDGIHSGFAKYLRTLLVLGRVSNLPTVWSNCLAGWLIGGGSDVGHFVLLILGATFLYLMGMFLNDAFDADFDRQHRPERPIPSERITVAAVWQWGLSWLGLGLLCFGLLGLKPFVWALLLSGCIFIYDAIHKMFSISPILMAGCRFFLILAAASVTIEGVTGYGIWTALVLACYIIGLSFLARKESLESPLHFWPCIFLAAPIVLALIVNRGPDLTRGIVLAVVLTAWILQSLRHAFWSSQRQVGRTVASLLAGIVIVDLLAVGAGSFLAIFLFLSLFLAALFFQRYVPAT
jgi:4-hydroxybenzoate polyprenyltransferase